jgi:hypothetical protein
MPLNDEPVKDAPELAWAKRRDDAVYQIEEQIAEFALRQFLPTMNIGELLEVYGRLSPTTIIQAIEIRKATRDNDGLIYRRRR